MTGDTTQREQLAARIAAALGPGVEVRYLPSCDSTSTQLRDSMDSAAPARLLFTDRQVAGRGTRGRDWLQTPRAGLDIALSYARPAASTDPRTALALGVALAERLGAASGVGVRLKWPNDLVAGEARRKLGGILLESTGGWLIAGVGINVNSGIDGFPPELRGTLTTLSAEAGAGLDIDTLLLECALTLHEVLSAADITPWLRRWAQFDASAGVRYRLERDGATLAVEVESVDALRGLLLARGMDGALHEVASYTDLLPT